MALFDKIKKIAQDNRGDSDSSAKSEETEKAEKISGAVKTAKTLLSQYNGDNTYLQIAKGVAKDIDPDTVSKTVCGLFKKKK